MGCDSCEDELAPHSDDVNDLDSSEGPDSHMGSIREVSIHSHIDFCVKCRRELDAVRELSGLVNAVVLNDAYGGLHFGVAKSSRRSGAQYCSGCQD